MRSLLGPMLANIAAAVAVANTNQSREQEVRLFDKVMLDALMSNYRMPKFHVNRCHPPHQGSKECARRQKQVAKMKARGRDWTGRALA